MDRAQMGTGSFEEFESLFDVLPGYVICGVVYHHGTPQGALFVLHTRRRAFYLCGGTAESVFPPGANRLLHWEAIKYCHGMGVEEYDFVGARPRDVSGTKLEHIQRFKARFGAELRQGYLWKIDLHPWLVSMYDVVSSLKRRVLRRRAPNPDIIDQENFR